MDNQKLVQKKIIGHNRVFEEPELKNLKLFYFLCAFLLITDIIMPQYFGIRLGYDITCTRLANILIFLYMLLNPKIFVHFFHTIMQCNMAIPMFSYLFVCAYTMVLRIDINALFLVLLEMLTLCMLIYGIRYVIGYERAIKWLICASYFFGVLGLVDFVRGKSLMLQLLSTLPSAVANSYRSGHYRIMGPCGHALAYGLFLILLIAIACVDLKRNEVYLFRRPVLIILLYINVFLTGSRSTLGIAILEAFLIILFSKVSNIKKTLLLLSAIIAALGFFLLIFHNTNIGQYILMQIASVIDQVFGTEYAALFGAETTRLTNSEEYRKALPLIFSLDWLNPIVGRGVSRSFGAEINGFFIQSIDNYYVSQYIKYAYPGMIAYILFIATILGTMIAGIRRYNSALVKMLFVGTVCYYINLWWLDALQTLKYEYIVIAVFYAYMLGVKEEKKGRCN